MTEVDNLSYKLGLGERLRGRVEKHGHVLLSDIEKASLARMKATQVGLVMFFVLGSVGFMVLTPCPDGMGPATDTTNSCGSGATIGTFFYLCIPWFGGLVELAVQRELTARTAMKALCRGFGAMATVFFTYLATVHYDSA